MLMYSNYKYQIGFNVGTILYNGSYCQKWVVVYLDVEC
jgi:hypothetical protein